MSVNSLTGCDFPHAVYEFLGRLSHCGFVYRDELPPEFEAPFAVARATDPPLVRVYDTGILGEVIDHGLSIQLPRLGVRLSRDGAAAVALYDMRAASREKVETATGPPPPRKLLNGWQDITSALGMEHKEYPSVKSLNERFTGPIKNSGKGTRPMVYHDELLAWWDTLAAKQQELANRKTGEKLSAETTYAYGRTGNVAPEIGGSQKERRKPKRR
jgi:hypothetical protein